MRALRLLGVLVIALLALPGCYFRFYGAVGVTPTHVLVGDWQGTSSVGDHRMRLWEEHGRVTGVACVVHQNVLIDERRPVTVAWTDQWVVAFEWTTAAPGRDVARFVGRLDGASTLFSTSPAWHGRMHRITSGGLCEGATRR